MPEIPVTIVLVRPRNPLNIGAAARAMANFGLSDLRVVAPHKPVWDETVSAPGAEDIAKSAKIFPSLEQALADCHLALGTSCGRHRTLARDIVFLPELGKFLEERGAARAAIVFGPEKTGLSRDQLSLCRAVLNIPTAARTPSMNLGQSVSVICYELSRIFGIAPSLERTPSAPPPTLRELEAACSEINELLKKAGFQKGTGDKSRTAGVRRALLETGLSRENLFYLRAIARRISEQ